MPDFSKITKRATTDVDHHIGQQLKALRIYKGMSQSELGEQIGVSFQQVQKYENGKNRISATTLFHLQKILDADIMDFFPEKDGTASESPLSGRLLDDDIVELIRLYERLPDTGRKKLTRQFIQLFSNLSNEK